MLTRGGAGAPDRVVALASQRDFCKCHCEERFARYDR
jgi:hypothetical protein